MEGLKDGYPTHLADSFGVAVGRLGFHRHHSVAEANGYPLCDHICHDQNTSASLCARSR
jgi:hypothetical protein